MNSTTSGASSNSTAHTLMGSFEICTFSINILFGLPTNSYILWHIVTRTRGGVASDFFNFNLCACEIGISLDLLCFVLLNWVSFLTLIALFFQGVIAVGRPLFQCLICVERYLAVVHPVTFLKYKPLRYRAFCCTVAWIIIFSSCLFCMFTSIVYNTNEHTWFFLMQFFPCLSIQLFCLVAVLRALKQSGPGERKRERDEENHMKKRAFYIILITTVNMVFAYGPVIISAVFILLTKEEYKLTFWAPSVVCYVLSGFVHPVLYLQRAGKLSFPCFL